MIRVNLLGVAEKREYKGLGQLFIGFSVLIALFIVLTALHLMQDKKLNGVYGSIAQAEQRIKELEAIKQKVDDFKAKNAELNRRIEIIQVLEKNRTGPLYVMDALGKSTPNRAWIDEFSEKGLQATLTGIADNEFTVADFMESLQKSPYFTGVELGVIKKTSIRNQSLRNFVIYSRLDYQGQEWKKRQIEQENHQ